MRKTLLATLGLAAVLACSKDSTGPATCGSSAVTATVSVGGSVTFDWSPACGVALLLVEDNGSDQWVIESPNLSGSPTEADNIIVPPVTYGQVPAGAQQSGAPATLTPGTTYDLVLWKVVAAGSSAQCQQKSGDACLLTVKAFQR